MLRAAREVFGEVGYGAPMEDVARRARVGVGTVYRRFTSKDVLVQRIAKEETARLTEQAQAAMEQEEQPWQALARFLRTAAASGAGRLLPPHILQLAPATHDAPSTPAAGNPQGTDGMAPELPRRPDDQPEWPGAVPRSAAGVGAADRLADLTDAAPYPADEPAEPAAQALLAVVGQLVDRARAAGELRADVTVSDVLLVMAAAAPSLPDAARQSVASAKLLDIMLQGLRSSADA